jgi:hypothetical protein
VALHSSPRGGVGGGGVYLVFCAGKRTAFMTKDSTDFVSSLEITIVIGLVELADYFLLCFESGRLHCEFSQPRQKKKEGTEGLKGTFLGELGPSHHL